LRASDRKATLATRADAALDTWSAADGKHRVGELAHERFEQVVDGDDADEGAGRVHHRDPPHAAHAHEVERVLGIVAFVGDREGRSHDLARGERRAVDAGGDRFHHDVAIGNDARGLFPVALHHDQAAHVLPAHQARGLDEGHVARRGNHVAIAHFSGLHVVSCRPLEPCSAIGAEEC
jgi:hypothetical protein